MAAADHLTPRHGQAALERDAALLRVSRVRRLAIVATAALTAGCAALVASIAPGKSLATKPNVASATITPIGSSAGARSAPALPPLAGAAQLGLQAPAQAPQPAQAQSQSSQAQASQAQAAAAQAAQAQAAQAQAAQAQAAQAQSQASAPAPASQPSGGGGAVVSGGS